MKILTINSRLPVGKSGSHHFVDQSPIIELVGIGSLLQCDSQASKSGQRPVVAIAKVHFIAGSIHCHILLGGAAKSIANLSSNIQPVGYPSSLAIPPGSIVNPIHKNGIAIDSIAQVSVAQCGHKIQVGRKTGNLKFKRV